MVLLYTTKKVISIIGKLILQLLQGRGLTLYINEYRHEDFPFKG
jgi:hypothetical protein